MTAQRVANSSLAGRVAIVTGASRGLGRGIAERLAHTGMAVAVHARTISGLTGTVAAIDAAGGTARPFAADIAEPCHVVELIADVQNRLGPIDLLVNNAGVVDGAEEPLWAADPGAWWQVVAVNLRGPMLTCHEVVPGMLARNSGRIVNVNTLSASRSDPAYSAYSAAKAGLARMTDSLATALRGRNVYVWDVSPGLVHTAMTDAMPVWAATPEDRWTSPERMAEFVVRIACGEADALSGRFLRATDDLDDLVRRLGGAADQDARRLRVQPHSTDDELPRVSRI